MLNNTCIPSPTLAYSEEETATTTQAIGSDWGGLDVVYGSYG